MSDVPSQGAVKYGWQDAYSTTSPLNQTEYLVDLITSRPVRAALVKVKKVTNEPGELKKPGRVDVEPLVNQTDGSGNATEHTTVYGLCYFRLQGGKNAVLCDPEVGDLGLAVICDRDISAVKATEDRANPGSSRRGNMADGIYFGITLGPIPDQYLRFVKDGMELHDKNNNKVTLTPSGMELHDKNNNKVTMNSAGVTIEDKNANKIVMASDGITLNP